MRLGIVVVAYNAESTLKHTLDRIPASVASTVAGVYVGDDHSADGTYGVGLAYKQARSDIPITVVRHPRNLGYGGNQKAGYRWAIEQGLDAVVLLHGDGQYAPELLEELAAPLERGASAVLGSRMLVPKAARAGGMPLYKYIGNRILTAAENKLVGLELSEWHSGYRAFAVSALRDIPFELCSDGFDFDTEVLIQLHEAGHRIAEVPIPTYYGDEICYVNGLAYARDVIADAARYRLHKIGFGGGGAAFASSSYEAKEAADASHAVVARLAEQRSPRRVLDLGCGAGVLAPLLRAPAREITGVDVVPPEQVSDAVDRYVRSDLEVGIPADLGRDFDVILMADVLEHLKNPEVVLADARRALADGGAVVASIPNFAHWYPRVRVALGRFDYDRRGILDRGHVRFFTARSFERLVREAGFRVSDRQTTGIPLEIVDRGASAGDTGGKLRSALGRLDAGAARRWPSLFAYQYVYVLEPA